MTLTDHGGVPVPVDPRGFGRPVAGGVSMGSGGGGNEVMSRIRCFRVGGAVVIPTWTVGTLSPLLA